MSPHVPTPSTAASKTRAKDNSEKKEGFFCLSAAAIEYAISYVSWMFDFVLIYMALGFFFLFFLSGLFRESDWGRTCVSVFLLYFCCAYCFGSPHFKFGHSFSFVFSCVHY